MENLTKNDELIIGDEGTLNAKMQRRSFLRYAGAGAAAMSVLAACKNNNDVTPSGNASIDVGSGDVGILNYAYALEQLEAAFYIQAVKGSGFASLSVQEQAYITDIRDHEVAHREFFKAALTAAAPTNIIPALTPDFSKVDFTTRAGILAQAKAFEDTGVSAYNGAGYLIVNPVYLVLAGKIVSVEARHAATIRDLLSYGSFSDSTVVSTSTGLETSRTPGQVLVIANAYLAAGSKISANSLPI
ncbi:ferritin-like protein [Mucilaginibacter gracilis]|uniref:Ferritin-like protein n=1 Tax=Mucilaginibacter gracilis TaxID=423350 RepID=A0A495IU99_9SPHI|nr:ferritin-like domain-containing protein [Mucilaginibacter gracilis]RKR80327.1 ferritin-like protein [Mucilaginibacter gracilis]